MGATGGVPRGARRPSHVAYYVALIGILGLLVMLCIYFFYYFIRKVNELRHVECLSPVPPPPRPPPGVAATYPVQPVVRDSASAMAKLCKQLPPAPSTSTSTKPRAVFPAATSPAALQTDTGDREAIQMKKFPQPALTVPGAVDAIAAR